MAVRERLWVLMGLDNVVKERDRELIDQDADTGEWGLPGQLGYSERGRIPDAVQTLVQRIEDEHVRQALNRGCTREMIAQVLGIHSRTTFHKQKRANAYAFPLDAIDGRGGRPPETESTGDYRDASANGPKQNTTPADECPVQTDGPDDSTATVTGTEGAATPTDGTPVDDHADKTSTAQTDDVRSLLQQAKAALEALEATL